MKLCVAILCACVVAGLGSVLPGPVVGAAGKGAAAKAKAGDAVRDWRRQQNAAQDWANEDQKSAQVNRDWDSSARSASSDSNQAAQDWSKASSGWDNNSDASNRAGSKAASTNAARDGKADWHASNNFDRNQNWVRNGGWKRQNAKRERIGYGFDKSYNRNANDNGGFNAGSSLADHALDDYGDRSSSFDRRQSDHAARAGNQDAQSADRSSGYGNGAWRNAAAADRNGRDWRQSAGANSNALDWAQKRDSSANANRGSTDRRNRALDALVDRSNVDRNANRASQANGNALGVGVRRPAYGLAGVGGVSAGKGYGYGAPARRGYGYGTPVGRGYGYGAPVAKGYGYVAPGYGGKSYAYGRPAPYNYASVGPVGVSRGYARNGAAADASQVADSANRNRQQNWDGSNWEDRTKDAASNDQWQSDAVQGFNRDRAATLWDQGAAANTASQNEGARAGDRQWADAKAAKSASQGRHDFDENDWKAANQRWNVADRDHDRKEWKKYFSNDKTGGNNRERLYYNRGNTDDHANADYARQQDNSGRWQDANQYDARAQRANGNDWAQANDARNRYWDSDNSRDANARDQRQAAAANSANRGRWGADNENRDYKVDQSRLDNTLRNQQTHDQDSTRAGFDARAGARGFIGARPGYGGYGNRGLGYNGGYNNGFNGGYNGFNGLAGPGFGGYNGRLAGPGFGKY